MKKALFLSTMAAACLFFAGQAQAGFDPHDWQLRLRAIDVSPAEKGHTEGAVPDLLVHADSRVMPELDISYFLTENFSAELILATTKHNMSAGGVDLGSVWVLPPTLTAQYHFDTGTPLRPYVGAGINYTVFYNADSGSVDSVKYDNGFGYAFQAGTDYMIDQHWSLNVDVKKIMLGTDVSVNGGAITSDVNLNPWVFGVGVGYRF